METQLEYTDKQIYSKMSLLNSEQLKKELLFYLDYLLKKQFCPKEQNRKPQFGCAKGTFKMAPDFDEPLEDFKDYM
ncbi:MAG TPA: DUF2281 domain-containing protein [Candidatus Kapabacteria bacterium]|nr:DUF2281 domain-containing protein [Candidatus Kapabacteria bacterium]HPO61795.1 DUF2281 domain-containing protein [Candidatus Kapabacteria bacterium]